MTPRLTYGVLAVTFLLGTLGAIYGLCVTPTDARWLYSALGLYAVNMTWIMVCGAREGEW